jgi:hypothetical protein
MHVYSTIWYLVRWYSSTIGTIGTGILLQEEVNIISLNSRSTVVSLHTLLAKHLVDAACRLFLARQFSGCVVLEVLFASGNCDMANEPPTSADRGPRPFT